MKPVSRSSPDHKELGRARARLPPCRGPRSRGPAGMIFLDVPDVPCTRSRFPRVNRETSGEEGEGRMRGYRLSRRNDPREPASSARPHKDDPERTQGLPPLASPFPPAAVVFISCIVHRRGRFVRCFEHRRSASRTGLRPRGAPGNLNLRRFAPHDNYRTLRDLSGKTLGAPDLHVKGKRGGEKGNPRIAFPRHERALPPRCLRP